MSREIRLNGKHSDKVAIVDDEDFLRASLFNWWGIIRDTGIGLNVVAMTYIDGKNIPMARWIMGIHEESRHIQVDHRNWNTLDNQKENLRICTQQQNTFNQQKRGGKTTSKYKGVFFHKGAKKWQASIKINYNSIYLGLFKDETQAALAYDKAAVKYFGEFANLNIGE